MRSQSKRTSRKPSPAPKITTTSMITSTGVPRRATVAEVEQTLTPRAAVAYAALQLPDGGSEEFRRMGERTLLSVALVLYARLLLVHQHASQAAR